MMTVRDGDPKVLAPDLVARLTSLEQRQVAYFYGLRLSAVGKGQRLNPDDESPASVAREAVVLGIFALGLAAATLPLFVFAISLSEAGYSGSTGWWLATALSGTFVLVCTVLSGIRYRQVNRYFTDRFPDSLDRWFFKPGFDKTSRSEANAREPTPEQPVEIGNPQTFAPDLLAQLTRLERAQVARAWAERFARGGSGKKKYPDDEPAESIARRTILRGSSLAALLVASTLLGALLYVAARFVIDPSTGWMIAIAVLSVALVLIWAFARRRRRQILDYFAERTPGQF